VGYQIHGFMSGVFAVPVVLCLCVSMSHAAMLCERNCWYLIRLAAFSHFVICSFSFSCIGASYVMCLLREFCVFIATTVPEVLCGSRPYPLDIGERPAPSKKGSDISSGVELEHRVMLRNHYC